jgi:hypothetical protein
MSHMYTGKQLTSDNECAWCARIPHSTSHCCVLCQCIDSHLLAAMSMQDMPMLVLFVAAPASCQIILYRNTTPKCCLNAVCMLPRPPTPPVGA